LRNGRAAAARLFFFESPIQHHFRFAGFSGFKSFGRKSVLADQFAVEPHLAAAPFLALDQHHVPVDRALVAVAAILVSLARREVQRAGDFLVEQDVAHRIQNVRIEAERKFADVTRAGVRVQNLIQPLRVVRRGLDDFAVLEFQPDVFKLRARIKRRRVELDDAVHGIFHRAGKHFAVGNVAVALAHLRADALDAEVKVRAGRFEMDAVRFSSSLFSGTIAAHLRVIHRADVEIQILERLRAHARRLRHARRGPAQHAPARLVHAIILHRPDDLE
jgi:hypothetical protein